MANDDDSAAASAVEEGWQAPSPESAPRAEEALVVDVEGFEGPLDLLLALARTQKVDIARISVLALAEQYLAFISEARRLRIEIAADYLVMAAWLAYLKSRLLLPEPPKDEEPSGEQMAEALQRQVALGRAARLQRVRAHLRQRLELQALGRRLVEPLGARERGKHADHVVLGMLVDHDALLGERAAQRIAEELREVRDRNHRAIGPLVHRIFP